MEMLIHRSKAVSAPSLLARSGYRRDIDGLRAIAVLSVILFHFDFPFLTGGYVGVDIFFVISGFLITRLLVDEIDSGNFSLVGFFGRRIRRIMPALFSMLTITSLLSFFTLIPKYYTGFAASAAATALSMSNFYFFKHSGYFDFGHEVVPLLHTWSLGVEEQFYVFFPIIFFVARRTFKLSWTWIILPPLLGSLLFGVMQSYIDIDSLLHGSLRERSFSNGAFYLPMARAWEFLIGSALATNVVSPSKGKPSNLLAWLAMALFTLSFVAFDKHTKFPGLAAIVPTIGAGLLIHTNRSSNTYVFRMLTWGPFVLIGLMSYSLYLWHWPVVVFFRLFFGSEHSFFVYLFLFASLFPIAWISWRFVELPVRSRDATFTQQSLFIGTGSGALAFSVLALVAIQQNGLPARFSPEMNKVAEAAGNFDWLGDCDKKSAADITRGDACTIGPSDAPISFALLGDSFADALSPAVQQAANESGRRGLTLTRGGCYPLLGILLDIDCAEFVEAAVRRVQATQSIEKVILIARWSAAVEGSRFGAIKIGGLFITDSESKTRGYAENKAVFQRSLARTVGAFFPRKVYVLAYLPEQSANVPQAAVLRKYFSSLDYSTPRSVVDSRQANTRSILNELSRSHGFAILDAMPALCDDLVCHGVEGGASLYADDNHLSLVGALKELPAIARAFSETTH
jgi:peptidoglycan/LPS O-acetylase OafA/YrhL